MVINQVTDFAQNKIFKPRTILFTTREKYEKVDLDKEINIITISSKGGLKEVDNRLRKGLRQLSSVENIESRLGTQGCFLYLATDGDILIGYYWSIIPQEPVSHDSFFISPGEALLFNAYVRPQFRRQGIYTQLLAKAHNHVLINSNAYMSYTIVEDRNKPSLRANNEFGLDKYGKNYLIKLWGRNVLSIVSYPDFISILKVWRGEKIGHVEVH
ncbi:GNAT family N-acetyltransferase [Halorussus halobius]|uniref:GNAT family N-acetyltransferase n=1 Tax=Halorussus halobius TaxID=1710537 RepID=UPI0010922197|nr:GNAT family N-acetyltransferase [Halorussus halobius]